MPMQIYLKWLFVYPVLNFLKLKKYDRKKIKLTFGRVYNKYWVKSGSMNGAYAYIVNKKAAQKIVDYNSPIIVQADVALNDLISNGIINSFAIRKVIFIPDFKIPTSIGNRSTWK
jgi:hypothetical protein